MLLNGINARISNIRSVWIGMKEKENELKESREGKKDQDIFETEAIRIEEMAIDGICGVY
jgi:mycofactocin precursor